MNPKRMKRFSSPSHPGRPAKKTDGRAEPQVFDEDEESILDEFMDKPAMPETGTGKEEKVRLGGRGRLRQ